MGNGEAEAAAAVAVGLLSVYYSCTCAASLPPSSPFWSVVHPAASARAARITGTRAHRTRRVGEGRRKIRNAVTSLMCCQCHVLREFFNAFAKVEGRKNNKKGRIFCGKDNNEHDFILLLISRWLLPSSFHEITRVPRGAPEEKR